MRKGKKGKDRRKEGGHNNNNDDNDQNNFTFPRLINYTHDNGTKRKGKGCAG